VLPLLVLFATMRGQVTRSLGGMIAR